MGRLNAHAGAFRGKVPPRGYHIKRQQKKRPFSGAFNQFVKYEKYYNGG